MKSEPVHDEKGRRGCLLTRWRLSERGRVWYGMVVLCALFWGLAGYLLMAGLGGSG